MGRPADESHAPSDVVERRSYVTLLFCDVSDYTHIIENLDPEDADELRASIVEVAHRIVTAQGGQVNQFVGDGLLAVFGFPNPDENAVRRALMSALEFHRAVAELRWQSPALRGLSVRIHSGVHAGLVFLRRGNPLAGQYELSGDAVNTAARLCSAAGRDEILVSDTTLHGLEIFFRSESVPPLVLKGKSYPVAASRVLGTTPDDEPERSRRGNPTFVGRERELLELETMLSEAARRQGGVACLKGDAGIGKSRLLREFIRRARSSHDGINVYRGICESYGDVVPLRPFLQILRSVLPVPKEAPPAQVIQSVERALTQIDESLRSHLPTLLEVLSVRQRDTPTSEEEPSAAVAITSVLLALATERPLLLVFDDWQWADDASVQVLGRLLRAQGGLPILIVIAARDIAADDPLLFGARRIELKPFDERESISAVEQLLQRSVSPGIALGIHQRSGGNPLFLEEICQSLPVTGELDAALGEGAIPRNVRELIQVRLGRLSTEPAELLRVASVLGNDFPLWLLRALTPAGQLGAALTTLVLAGFLVEEEPAERVRFRHGIAREVVYDSVRVRERRRLHAEVARVLEATFNGVALVDHYEALASHHAAADNAERAIDFAELSGDKATASQALDRARVQYAAALAQLDLLPSSPEHLTRRFSLVSKWAAACVFNPSRSQLDVLERALTLSHGASDNVARTRIEYWLGWLSYALGDQTRSVKHSSSALALAQALGDPVSEAQIYSNLGQSHAAAGDYEQALACLERGIEMKRRRGQKSRARGLPVGFAYALGCRGLVYADRGEFDAAYVQIQEGLHVVRDSGHPVEGSLLCVLGMTQIWQGRWEDAIVTAERGRRTAERVNGPYVHAICQVVSGYADFVQRPNDRALGELERALGWLENREIGLYLAFSYSHFGHALLLAGRLDAARDFAERAVSRALISDPLGQALGERTLAALSALHGDRDVALAHVERALASARSRDSERDLALSQLTLSEVRLSFGEAQEIRPLLSEASDTLLRLGMLHHHAEAQRLLSKLIKTLD